MQIFFQKPMDLETIGFDILMYLVESKIQMELMQQ